MPNVSKLYERAMHSRVILVFRKIQAAIQISVWFQKKHSTNQAILSTAEDIHQHLDKRTLCVGFL